MRFWVTSVASWLARKASSLAAAFVGVCVREGSIEGLIEGLNRTAVRLGLSSSCGPAEPQLSFLLPGA
jgi:hypothetical protein